MTARAEDAWRGLLYVAQNPARFPASDDIAAMAARAFLSRFVAERLASLPELAIVCDRFGMEPVRAAFDALSDAGVREVAARLFGEVAQRADIEEVRRGFYDSLNWAESELLRAAEETLARRTAQTTLTDGAGDGDMAGEDGPARTLRRHKFCAAKRREAPA